MKAWSIEDNVFIGHGVTFINDSYPRATTSEGGLQTEADWKVERTVIRKGASIGSGATILSNINVGENAIVGAGSVVTKDVPSNAIVAGNPARVLRYHRACLFRPRNRTRFHFFDLVTPHLELENRTRRRFPQGAAHRRLRRRIHASKTLRRRSRAFCDAGYCVAVSSGTDALRFALMAAGVKPGDVVVTVPNTFIATTEAISQAGAIPEFVDIDEQTLNMSVEMLQEFLERQCTQRCLWRTDQQCAASGG